MLSKLLKCLKSLVPVIPLVLIASLALLCTPSTALAQLRVFVDEDSTATTPTGASWPTAYRHLPDGITQAVILSDDGEIAVQVWVAEGTYRPDENEANPTGTNPPDAAARAMSFQMHDNVKMYGGFVGTEAATPTGFNTRQPYENITILSGDLLENDDPEDPFDPDLIEENSYHVVTAIVAGTSAVLDGFTIRSGNAVGADFPGYPDSGSNPDVVPEGGGGGLLILSRNSHDVIVALPKIVRCTFEHNIADYGGAVLQHGPQHTSPPGSEYVNCVFRHNHAEADGGAFYNYGMSNITPPPGPCASYSAADLYNCLVVDNTADGDGGAYWGDRTCRLNLINGTVVANSTGIYQQTQTTCGFAAIKNSIIYRNGDDCGANCDFIDQIDGCCVITYSCVQDLPGSLSGCQSVDQHSIATDPDFVDEPDDYRLDPLNSPCINTGNDANVPFDTFDVHQVKHLPGPPSPKVPDLTVHARLVGTVDLGVYEVQPSGSLSCIPEDVNDPPHGDGQINIHDLLFVIANWGPCVSYLPCYGYIASPSNAVDIADLLAVIAAWGACPGQSGGSQRPESVDDCWTTCEAEYPDDEEKFIGCYHDCLIYLCTISAIPCD